MWGSGVENENEILIDENFYVDKSNPLKKKKKPLNKAKGSALPDGLSRSQTILAERNLIGVTVKKAGFLKDPELEQGFPEKEDEYSTTPCLADIKDEFLNKYEKARTLKRKQTWGIEDAIKVDDDFDD